MAKHPAGPTFSTIGCNMATAPPALRQRTRLLAAWAVAERFMFRSVRRVPQSWEGQHISYEAMCMEDLTVNVAAVAVPVRSCIMSMTAMC
jgi:hypothetical protein